MIDVKKLITGFLILATAAVSSGLILSFINSSTVNNSALNNPAGNTPQVAIGSNSAPAIGTNAFTPTADQLNQVVAAVAPELASSTMMQTSTNPSNLTDVLATNFVNGVVAANPNGPTANSAGGSPIIASPDVNAVALNVADASITKNLKIPNWDIEARSIPIVVVSSSPAALTSYGNAMNDVLNNHFTTQVQTILNNQTSLADASDVSYLTSQIQNALKDVASLKTPAPVVAYQKSFLTQLVYEKNMLQLYTLAQSDPVKASLIFEQESQKFDVVNQTLLNQAQNLESNFLSFQSVPQKPHDNILLSFINNTFGIPQAQAVWPVFDPATWGLLEGNQAVNEGNVLRSILKNTLLQILKNTLIALIQQKVLAWVQGSGAPRFITDWGTQLIDSAQQMAVNKINSDMASCVYPTFIPIVLPVLEAPYLDVPATVSCEDLLAGALGPFSFQQYYDNFSNGGFIAFGASTLPGGNPFGTQYFESQSAAATYQTQQAASALQAQTSQGFKGSGVCADGSDPNGESSWCVNPAGQRFAPADVGNGTVSCNSGDKIIVTPNNGVCANGSNPIVTTPASVTASILKIAEGGTTQQITSASDIVGLLNATLNSLMLQLSNTAINAAGLITQNFLAGIQPSNITGGGTPPASQPLACNPASQTIPAAAAVGGPLTTGPTPTSTFPTTFSAIGGTTDANGNYPTYYWTDSNGVTSTGSTFSDVFPNTGTYTATVTDSVPTDAPATCTVTVQ